MRLICPRCEAEYEIDAAMIPPEGRDVQCSNCSHTWFQSPEKFKDDDEEKTGAALSSLAAATAAARNAGQQRASIDPEALDVIHEEVELETRTRRAEAEAIETQTDLGLAESEARKRVSALITEDREETEDVVAPAPKRETAGKKLGHLPDIEEINSTLPSAPTVVEVAPADEPAKVNIRARRKRGFRLGFALMLLITAACLACYIYAPQLAERFPQMADLLEQYVAIVNGLRLWLDGAAEWLLGHISELVSRFSES